MLTKSDEQIDFLVVFIFLLASNKSLTYLNISWNLIRSFASIALFRSFEVSSNRSKKTIQPSFL